MKSLGIFFFFCFAWLCVCSSAQVPLPTFLAEPIKIGECLTGITGSATNFLKLANQFYLGELGNDIFALIYYTLLGPALIIMDYEGSRGEVFHFYMQAAAVYMNFQALAPCFDFL